MKTTKLFGILTTITALFQIQANAQTWQTNTTVTVPATSDIWLAGADYTANLFGDTITTATPFVITNFSVKNLQGGKVAFGATGVWANGPGANSCGPNGDNLGSHLFGATNYGIGLVLAPANSLIAVFTDDTPFQSRTIPSQPTIYSQTQAVFYATINQPFYVGDGTNNLGNQITFVVPDGASHFYLGMNDIDADNNSGSANVQIFSAGLPILNVQKAIYLDSANLLIGTNYQLQITSDFTTWTNSGSVFTATNFYWHSPNYFDVNNTNRLFFRLLQQ